jgi:hypothetical protein
VPTKRVTLKRMRAASPINDPATIKLFAELERVPLSGRSAESYNAKEDDLAWRLGLHAEHRFDAHRVNDKTLIDCRPKYDCFLDSWRRVTTMRTTLLALAGLPPDPRLFWCRICGEINTGARAVRQRHCEACHKFDHVSRLELAGMTKTREMVSRAMNLQTVRARREAEIGRLLRGAQTGRMRWAASDSRRSSRIRS